jgi:hypothetical protein
MMALWLVRARSLPDLLKWKAVDVFHFVNDFVLAADHLKHGSADQQFNLF